MKLCKVKNLQQMPSTVYCTKNVYKREKRRETTRERGREREREKEREPKVNKWRITRARKYIKPTPASFFSLAVTPMSAND